jgi:hypothetical protein
VGKNGEKITTANNDKHYNTDQLKQLGKFPAVSSKALQSLNLFAVILYNTQLSKIKISGSNNKQNEHFEDINKGNIYKLRM